MTARTLRIGLRATALSLLGGAALFNTDVRAMEGCNEAEECREAGSGVFCASDLPDTSESHCAWSISGTEFSCLTDDGACDQS